MISHKSVSLKLSEAQALHFDLRVRRGIGGVFASGSCAAVDRLEEELGYGT